MKLILIVALAISSAGSAQQTSHAQERHGIAVEPQSASQTQLPPSVPNTLEKSLDRIGAALEAANNKQTSTDEVQRAKQGLAAQLIMARSAERMFYVGLSETIVTFIGVMLVLATLIYTKKSADAARDSVTEAKAATKAAKSLQLPLIRASIGYLLESQSGNSGIRNDSMMGKGAAVHDLVFYNEGRGDAYPKQFSAGYLISKNLPVEPGYSIRTAYDHGTVAKQGDSFAPTKGWIFLPPTDDEIQNIAAGKAELRFYVQLIFSDFTGDMHEYCECWVHRSSENANGYFRFIVDEAAPPAYRRKT